MTDHLAPPDQFGRAARDYETGRPGWPDEIFDLVDVPRDATVLDLGAGTGKLTRSLVARFRHVIAVEPDESMLALLRELVPSAEARLGAAEAIPLEDEAVDAAFVAEAFHWFDAPSAAAELARVLRPRGLLVLLWTKWTETTPPLSDEAEHLLEPAFARGGKPGIVRVEAGTWREPVAAPTWEPLREERIRYEFRLTRETLIANFLSVSSLAALPDDEREELRDGLRRTVADVEYRREMTVEIHWTRLA